MTKQPAGQNKGPHAQTKKANNKLVPVQYVNIKLKSMFSFQDRGYTVHPF